MRPWDCEPGVQQNKFLNGLLVHLLRVRLSNLTLINLYLHIFFFSQHNLFFWQGSGYVDKTSQITWHFVPKLFFYATSTEMQQLKQRIFEIWIIANNSKTVNLWRQLIFDWKKVNVKAETSLYSGVTKTRSQKKRTTQ